MSCPDVGTLRAYLDRELPARRADEVARHLGSCPTCREQLAELEKVAGFAGSHISRLAPSSTDRPTEAPLAFARLRHRSAESQPFGARLAAAFAGLAALLSPARVGAGVVSLAIVAAVLFTPVGLYAQGLLSVFRANDVQAVQIDPSALASFDFPSPQDLGTIKLTSEPEVKSATLADAGKQAGLTPATLSQAPAGFASNPLVAVTTAAAGSFTYDLSKIEAYYQKRGLSSKPPAELDGLTVNASLPPAVLQVYASQATLDQITNAEKAASTGEQGTPTAAEMNLAKSPVLVLAQVKSPQIDVPGNAEAIRQKVLASGALPPEIALQLEAIGNWQNTIPIPVLAGTSQDVTIDGVHGILVSDKDSGGSWAIWVKNGVVYGLGGNVSESVVRDAAQHLAN